VQHDEGTHQPLALLDHADALWLADVRGLLVDDSDIDLEGVRRLLEHRRARDAGTQGFLTKGLVPAQPIRRLRRFVDAARGAALPVKGLDSNAPQGGSPWPLIEGTDTADDARRLGRDVPLFLSMLRRLRDEFGGLPAMAQAAPDDTGAGARLPAAEGDAALEDAAACPATTV
jgi:hypothetical protein